MHPHMAIQAYFLIGTVRTLVASVLFSSTDIFRRRFRRIYVRLVAAWLGAGRFRVIVVSFVDPVGTVICLMCFQGTQGREADAARRALKDWKRRLSRFGRVRLSRHGF